MPWHPRSAAITVATLMVLTAAWTLPSAAASSRSCGGWTVVPSQDVGDVTNWLVGVGGSGPADVWAVGFVSSAASGDEALIEHFDGSSWAVAPPAQPAGGTYLRSVVAISPTDAWAVGHATGTDGEARTLAERWDGATWSVVRTPAPFTSSSLFDVAAASATDVWAVGHAQLTGSPKRPLIEHWDGLRWKIVAAPGRGTGPSSLVGVDMVGPADAWAVGHWTSDVGGERTLAEHWNGTDWRIVPTRNVGPEESFLSGVAAPSPNDVWAVGQHERNTDHGRYRTLIEHWDGTSWSVETSPNVGGGNNHIQSVDAWSASDIWAVGRYAPDSSDHPYRTMTLHWDGSIWSVVKAPSPSPTLNLLFDVAAIDGTNVWTVGFVGDAHSVTLTELYC